MQGSIVFSTNTDAVWAKVATYKYGTEPKISTDAAFVAAGAVESVLSVSI